MKHHPSCKFSDVGLYLRCEQCGEMLEVGELWDLLLELLERGVHPGEEEYLVRLHTLLESLYYRLQPLPKVCYTEGDGGKGKVDPKSD